MKKVLRTSSSLAALFVLMATLTGMTGPRADVARRTTRSMMLPADTNDPDSANTGSLSGLGANDPSNYKEEVDYDPETGMYTVTQKVGNLVVKPPMLMTPSEYQDYVRSKQVNDYWNSKTKSEEAARAEGRDPGSSLIPQIQVNSEFFSNIFGSNTIDIRPQGYAELRFGGRFQKIDNPLIPERNRSTFTFDFDQRIQMNVTGKVGEKLQIRTNYDTEATFSFENQVKVEFNGDEDDIIKKLELGNVSLPLNSSLITGAQSLFGFKGQFQFGKLTLTSVISEQRSQSSSINVQGGATTTEFEIWADQYEANRHYFLSQYFRNNYERFLGQMPVITSPVQITKVEVWVTNTRQNTEDTRNIVAFMDLGEGDRGAYRSLDAGLPGPVIFNRFTPYQGYPDNRNNTLDPDVIQQDYPNVRDIGRVNSALNAAGFEEAIEYAELSNARKLQPSEYNFHPQLGYLSLNTSLNQDEVLAVAFQFTAGGRTFQVGEFSTDGITPPQTLILKMLKSTILNVKAPMWDLMMKNIYSLSAFQVNREDFRLDILYQNDETGTPIPFLPEGDISDDLLVRVVELDRLNNNNDPLPDGFFDFVPGITIKPNNGRIIFPVLEPFGRTIAEKLNDPELVEKYAFTQLYDSTRFVAQNETQLNKYLLRGQFKSSSSSEISLNAFNIPQGSVTVSAGGVQLVENVDYTVDYNLGRVKIINDGILNSGTPVKVDFENNAAFNFNTKTFMGLNADYRVNEKLNLGGTIIRQSERPLTQKVNIGEEPIANMMWGLNGSFSDEAPYLTRFTDAIPLIDTKEKSTLQVNGEFAQLVPGSPRGIKIDGEATTYLDDFESSQTTISILNPNGWELASVPAKQPQLFPEGEVNSIESGYNRARLAWYTIDPLFTQQNDARTPNNIRDDPDLQSGQFVRSIPVNEVFPNVQIEPSQPRNLQVLDLAYYPKERGPYNYVVEDVPNLADGLEPDGELKNPSSRWGGIMRNLTTTNFEEQNIEFIQFWVLNPFYDPEGKVNGPNEGGDFYINLGSISEDVLRDGQQAVENGIPSDGDINKLDSTYWGYFPKVRPVVDAFDNDPETRNRQDVGYDLLDDLQEGAWEHPSTGATYLDRLDAAGIDPNSAAYLAAQADPSADNFEYFRGPDLDAAEADILERYKYFNNPQGNSDPNQINGIAAFATNQPDVEDINRDQTMSKTETYYQYRISMRPEDLGPENIGRNYITDVLRTTTATLPNGDKLAAEWIQFKVPVFDPVGKVGPIGDFRSIRFMRMFMKNFPEDIVLRFAQLELVRGEWRRYTENLDAFGDDLNNDIGDNTLFEVNAVNIEQNGQREPVPYVLPPGIDRQVLFGTTAATQQNEQALSIRVCNLQDGAARAAFRNLDFDMRMYNRLKMFTHMEDASEADLINQGGRKDLTVFIRLGSDYNQNFYEYEIPLAKTEWGETDPERIWPEENRMDFALSLLKEVKLERDRVYGGSQSITEKYSVQRGLATVSVVGAPNLGNVRTIMIGVRNPKKQFTGDGDDGQPKCAEIWVNELRLTEFDQRGGWAANARVAAQLADFANVSVSGRISTVGFGSIDQKVNERQKEEIRAYDFQSSVELGKFFPKDAGLRIPMYFSNSEEWKSPQFDPLNPDIEFEDALANLETEEERQELRDISQDYLRRRSLNFTNVRKERVGPNARKTPMPWNIENFSATYTFNETYRRNISIKEDVRRDYRGSLNYNYRINPKPIEPFKNANWLNRKYFGLIRDFNFTPYPRGFTAIASLDRTTNTMQMRNTNQFLYPGIDFPELPVTRYNSFNFNRQYSLLWDLSKSLKIDFNANMRTRIDELVDTNDFGEPPTFTEQEKRDEIWNNLADFGRPTNYHQTLNVNWQVPIDKLPFMDFVNMQARYTGDYDWMTNSQVAINLPADDSLNFGNTIQNNRQIQLNSTLNFLGLYNKIPYFKKVNSGSQQARNNMRQRTMRRPGSEEENKEGEEEEDEETLADKVLAATVRVLLMVRNANASYTRSDGTILPGFRPTPGLMGMDQSSAGAPGLGFTLGSQADIRGTAASNGWLVTTPYLNNQYTETYNESMNFRVTIEPVNNLRLVLTATKTQSSNLTEFFRFDEDFGDWTSQNTFETFNYNISYIMWGTSFEKLEAPNYSSDIYQNFLDYRLNVSERLANEFDVNRADIWPELVDRFPDYSPDLIGNPDSTNYGYRLFSVTSPQTMIPAFVAAYSGRDINNFDLDPIRSIPLPNWQLTYDGLTKIDFLRKLFQNAVLEHSYRSTYSINNISTNLLRDQALQDDENPTDNNGDLLPEYQINSVSLTEQYAPLLGINIKLKNQTTLRIQYKKTRNVVLSLTNNQVTETKGTEWVIGTGYIINDVRLKFVKLGPRRTSPVSNLELRGDVGIRDNITIIRRIVEESDQVTAGQRVVTAKLSADYRISQRVSAKLYYDLNLSRYKTSNAFPITTNQFGISVRLNLGQ